ncbi:MAG TPA: protein kinase [Actinopolymorphaceae bacterium]
MTGLRSRYGTDAELDLTQTSVRDSVGLPGVLSRGWVARPADSAVVRMPTGEHVELDAGQRLVWRSAMPLTGDDRARFQTHLAVLRGLGPPTGVAPVAAGGVDQAGHGWFATLDYPSDAAAWIAGAPVSRDRVRRVADTLTRAIQALHTAGLAAGEISLERLLVAEDGSVFLDPPPPTADAAPSSESYSVAVTLRTLLGTAELAPAIRDLLEQGMSPDPRLRPSAAELARAVAVQLAHEAEQVTASVNGSFSRTAVDGEPLDDAEPSADKANDPSRLETLPPTSPPRAESGTPLGSRYLLDTVIGTGATGRVWQGRRRADGSPVAVKVLRPEFGEDPAVVQRFLRESATLRAIRHPHLVQIHDLVAEGDTLAIVMDLVDGEDLRQLASRAVLSGSAALTVLSQVAAGLAAVHAAGVVHRDVKPENVLVAWEQGAEGERPYARLTDFGLARAADSPALTQTSQLVGTLAYVAPELVAGRAADTPVDVYALGVMAYELLAGERPFDAPHTAALLRAHVEMEPRRPPAMSSELWGLVSRCLAKDPSRRPTADEVARRCAELARTPVAPPLPPRIHVEPPRGPAATRPGDPEYSASVPTSGAQQADAGQRTDPTPSGEPAPAGSAPPTVPEHAGTSSAGLEAVAAEVDLAGRQPTTGATRPLAPAPTEPPRKGRRRAWILAGTGVAVVGLVAGLWFGRPTPEPAPKPTPEPVPQQYALQVVAISPKPGTVRLTFPDMSDTEGFSSYIIWRDSTVLDQVDPAELTDGSYLIPRVDTTTEHCYRVFALVETARRVPRQTPRPACIVADGKSR